MATGLLETGPKLNWTRDNKIFDLYKIWKEKVELIFSSALEESSAKQKASYLRYWMGEQGIPLVKKWTALGKLDFSSSEEDDLSSGYILQNYWNLLEAEFRPNGNKLLSVIELWIRSRQGSKTLNEWLTYVYNLVESCDYCNSSERIIRDVLIIGCNSDKEKDKIVRQGEKNQTSRSDRNSTIRRFNQTDSFRDDFYHAEDPLCILREEEGYRKETEIPI